MRNFAKIILLSLCSILLYSFSYAQQWRWSNWWSTPLQVFENVVGAANSGHDKIQQTAINGVTDLQWSYARQYKISNTIDYLRRHIGPYIQWAVYVWLILSTTGLILCWFLMVTWWIWKSSGFEKVKWRVVSALLGIFMLSWFYIVIKFMMWIINTFFWQ